MNPTDEAMIDNHLLEVTNAIHLGKLLPILLKNELYTDEEIEKEIGAGSPPEQTKKMILGVKRKGQMAYNTFIECLVEAEMFEAAHMLRPDEIKVPEPKEKQKPD